MRGPETNSHIQDPYLCTGSEAGTLDHLPGRDRRPGTPRSAKTGGSDQIFASVVATLLALMDGLSDRGHVVVLAATNQYGPHFPLAYWGSWGQRGGRGVVVCIYFPEPLTSSLV